MNIIETPIKDLVIIEPRVFKDDRGYFYESFNEKSFKQNGLDYNWVQDNQSFSTYGTLRGLHLQRGDHAQAKLVRVLTGSVLDVGVDLRPNSETYGQHYSVELTAENKKMFLLPRGFAHGFVVLSETATFAYKCDNFYNKDSESGLIYNDTDLKIDWKVPVEKILLSDKDRVLPTLKEFPGV